MAAGLKEFVDFIEKGPVRKYFRDTRFNPSGKTDGMTSPVGVDSEGKLWSVPYNTESLAPFKITMTKDAGGNYSLNKSFLQIKEAYDLSRNIFIEYDGNELIPNMQLVSSGGVGTYNYFIFEHIGVRDDEPAKLIAIHRYRVTVDSYNDVSVHEVIIPENDAFPNKKIVFNCASGTFVSGFDTEDYYNELLDALFRNRTIDCVVESGLSRFYLSLRRHVYQTQHPEANELVFYSSSYNSDIRAGWWCQLEITSTNAVVYLEGEFDAREE